MIQWLKSVFFLGKIRWKVTEDDGGSNLWTIPILLLQNIIHPQFKGLTGLECPAIFEALLKYVKKQREGRVGVCKHEDPVV